MQSVFQTWHSLSQLTRACNALQNKLLIKAWLSWRAFTVKIRTAKALFAEEHRSKVLQTLALLGWRALAAAQKRHDACLQASDAHYVHALQRRAWSAWRVRALKFCWQDIC
jgi:hypothetical protein